MIFGLQYHRQKWYLNLNQIIGESNDIFFVKDDISQFQSYLEVELQPL